MNSVSAPARPAPALSRVLGHRTPRYLYNRTRQLIYERGHADAPWLTPAAIGLLESLLRPADRGVEFGSGRSTAWFARRVAALTSVEHDERWYETVTATLRARGLRNVDYILAPGDQPVERGDESIDFALVDGHYRDYSAKFILPKIKPGGMLIIDNVNWYLPCQSKAPNSRTAALGPQTPVWGEVAAELAGWRSIWTSSGVWDTAIFIKN
jgi:predicted O-methyltransferase YrrM